MKKSESYKSKIFKYVDEDTKREVWRLTAPDIFCSHPYFYHKCMSSDNSFIIFGSEIGGERHMFSMDLRTQEIMQLTDRERTVFYQACLTGDDRYLIYATTDVIARLDMETLKDEVLYEVPQGWWVNKTFGVTPDGSHVVQVQAAKEDMVPRNEKIDMAAQWAAKPRCRFVLVDVEKKESRVIFDEKLWVAHPQLRPRYKDILMYCHEGPGRLIDSRIWFMDADGSNIRCPRHHEKNEAFTHEYWFNDGSAIGYVAYTTDSEKRDTTIRKIDISTMKETVIMPCTSYSHCAANNTNTMIVGDGRDPMNPYIFLADMRTGRERKLCRHDTSWKSYFDPGIGELSSQDAHPHPQFSQDGTKVIFNSDKAGLPGVYITDVSDL